MPSLSVALLVALGLLAGAAMVPSLAAAAPAAPTATLVARLDERLPGLMERYEVPGVAIALIQDGEVTWTQAYGLADASSGRALGPDSVFRAESLSKPIAANTVLALLVEEVTGAGFASVAEDRVLGPLGMADAGFSWDEDRAARLAVGHELDESTVAPYVYATSASGGLLATVDDLGRFAAVLATADAASTRPHERAISRLLTPTGPLGGPYRAVADRQGMGVFLETLPEGGDAAFSGGQGHGWMSHLHVLPGTGAGIVILTNSQRSWPLIAHVLTDWAEHAGAGTVGMGRIVTATRLLWGAIAAILAASAWQGWRLARQAACRPDDGRGRPTRGAAPRLLQAAVGLSALGTLVWLGQQDYLFVTSVFPAASPWLGASIGVLGVMLVTSAAAPVRTRPGSVGQPSDLSAR